MTPINYLAIAVILLTAVYFIVLGLVAISKPAIAARFLLGFAENPAVHYLELLLRLAVGLALLHHSVDMVFSTAMELFGWILILSTLGLLIVPWRWHRNFAKKLVPYANQHLAIIGVISLCFGITLLWSMKLWPN